MRAQVDFLEQLNFFLEALGLDARKSGNVLVFEYDPSYPRIYEIDAANVIKTIEYAAKIFLFSQSGARILVRFRVANYNSKNVNFDVIISSNKPLQAVDENFGAKMRSYAKTARADVKIQEDKILIKISGILPDAGIENRLTIKSGFLKKYNALIAYNDETAFEILSKQLKFIGMNVRPKSDVKIFREHVINGIYKPDIVFLQKDFLTDEAAFSELLKFQKRKRFCVVIICEDANPARFWDKSFVKLAQPYTYDVLRAAINECLKRRSLAVSDAAK